MQGDNIDSKRQAAIGQDCAFAAGGCCPQVVENLPRYALCKLDLLGRRSLGAFRVQKQQQRLQLLPSFLHRDSLCPTRHLGQQISPDCAATAQDYPVDEQDTAVRGAQSEVGKLSGFKRKNFAKR